MKLEDQLASLTPSIKLAELGVPQNSLYYWTNQPKIDAVFVHEGPGKNLGDVSAFTVAELIDLLPWSVTVEKHEDTPYYFEINKSRDTYHCGYHELDTWRAFNSEQDDSLADCLAKMLIYLIENNLITV